MRQVEFDDKFNELDENITSRWRIYVDTCSLYTAMKPRSIFWENFEKILKKNDAYFIMTYSSYEEIKKHKRGNNPNLSQTATKLENQLAKYTKDHLNLCMVAGDPGEFHDEYIQSKIRKRARTHNQVYITNDLENAFDVYSNIFNSKSVTRDLKKLLIYRVTSSGHLVTHQQLKFLSDLNNNDQNLFFEYWHKDHSKADRFLEERTSFRAKKNKFINKNIKKSQLEDENDTNLEVVEEFKKPCISSLINPDYNVPGVGDTLHAVRGDKIVEISLDKKLARGGEGVVYTISSQNKNIDQKYLAKIYKKSKLYKNSNSAHQTNMKINYIVGSCYFSRPIKGKDYNMGKYVKFPEYVLLNDNDEFVGYLMTKAPGIQLSRFIADASIADIFNQIYPNITKTDLIDICISFLEVMHSLHSKNIIVGDLNNNNILIDVPNRETYLIDADSYQYEDKYPCNVGIEKYTSPEFLKNHEDKFRTLQNELFVVARILFEILMLVDNPYNSKIASDPIQDMIDGRFRYTFEYRNKQGERISNKEAPSRDLIIRWGQLTKIIKDSFGNTFNRDGSYWEPGSRRTTKNWISYLNIYKNEILESVANKDGIVSNEVFPSQKRKWITRLKCVKCGKKGEQEPSLFNLILDPEFDRNSIGEISKTYHFDCYCAEKGYVEISCSKCGEFMGYGYKTRSDGKDYICSSCWTEKECIRCGKPFALWMLDNEGRCRHCKNNSCEPCRECGTATKVYILKKNNGLCNKCKNGVDTYCANCGTYVGKKIHRNDRKNFYCDDCWKPVECTACGWSNNGKLSKWMVDSKGRCNRCASLGKSPIRSNIETKNVNVSNNNNNNNNEKNKKSFLERIFGW